MKTSSQLLSLFLTKKGLIAAVTLSMLVGRTLSYVFPYLLQLGLDVATRVRSDLTIDQIAGAALVTAVVQTVFGYFSMYGRERLGFELVVELRNEAYRRLIRQPHQFHHSRPPAELVSRLSGDSMAVFKGTSIAADFIGGVFEAAIGIAIMLSISVKMTVLGLLILPFVGVTAVILARAMRRYATRFREVETKTGAHAQRTLEAFKTVQAFGQEAREVKVYKSFTARGFQQRLGLARVSGGTNAVAGWASGFPFLLLIWFGGAAITTGELTVGEVSSFLIYLLLVTMSIREQVSSWGVVQRVLGESKVLLDWLRLPVPKDRRTGPDERRAEQLAVDGVSFAYPDAPLEPVLTEVYLKLESKSLVAVVGRSGAGKSTLSALIVGHLQPTWGKVLCDGIDTRELSAKYLRSVVGIVDQQPSLFPGTIADNIAYGCPGATLEEVQHAARRAHVHDFILRLANGYETEVGEQGDRMSGGQRQRIALARALLPDPSFLLLDEVTSALDAESETEIHAALEEIAQTRGVLVIAHRLRTVQSADHILVMDGGRIVEEGDHEGLMRLNGVYRHLAELQMHDAQLEQEVTGFFQGDLDD